MPSNRHKVATTDELHDPGSRIISEVDGREIAVFNVDGEFYAVANYCVHQGGPLCQGQLTGQTTIDDDGWDLAYVDEGAVIQCPWHTWKFDVRTGKNLDDSRLSAPTYDVELQGSDVYVVM